MYVAPTCGAGETVFSPSSTARKSACWPPSPCKGKGRGTPTGGLSIRPSPDRRVGSAEARASGTAHAAQNFRMTAQPDQTYNLCLSEMRHYADDDTMVLVLSQQAGAVQEAEYPVPLEQDTSEILDAEDDDVLAGYAEAASRLLKPNPHSVAGNGLYQSSVSPAKLFKYDDVSHERFDSQTYPSKQEQGHPTASSRREESDSRNIVIPEDGERDAEGARDSSPALFSSTEPVSRPSTWAGDKPVVDDASWMQPPATLNSNSFNSKVSSSSAGHRLHHESHPSSAVRVSNGATPPNHHSKKKSKPKPFFPPAPSSTASGVTAPPRNPHDSFQHTAPQDPQTFHPSSPVPPRVNNGARLKVNNGMSPNSSRAAIRERRAAERSQHNTRSPTEQTSPTEHGPSPSQPATPSAQPSYESRKVRGFWDSAQSDSSDHSNIGAHVDPIQSPVDRATDCLQDAQPAQPFFPHVTSTPSARGHGNASSHAQFEWSKPAEVRDFFASNAIDTASAPEAEPLQAQVKDAHGMSNQHSSSIGQGRGTSGHSHTHDTHASIAQHHQQPESVAALDAFSHPIHSSPGYEYDDTAVYAADPVDEVETVDHKGLMTADEHHDASRSFARAVSISSLETVVPEHSIRGRSSPRNSALRRSSRRDAHMKSRIATLDTSNLSAYSSSTLRRLAKDLGLSNTYKLSKSELVVQLVSEIILANMSLGWGVPEVAQGVLAEDHVDDGYSSSDDEDSTVYKFSEHHGRHHRQVSVEEAVPHATLQRGRDTVERLSIEHREPHASSAPAAGSKAGGLAPWQQVDVDSDFENMSKLSMSELQQMCEDMKIEGCWGMRKFQMISNLLQAVYEV